MFDELKLMITARITELMQRKAPPGDWTLHLMEGLSALALQLDLDPRFTQRIEGQNNNWELLCDHLWLETEAGPARNPNGYFTIGHRLKNCVLACEIEWDYGVNVQKRMYDFNKLLLMNSKFRLFIVNCVNSNTRDTLLSEINAALAALELPLPDNSLLIAIHVHNAGQPVEYFER
jgi:hypothetical protein